MPSARQCDIIVIVFALLVLFFYAISFGAANYADAQRFEQHLKNARMNHDVEKVQKYLDQFVEAYAASIRPSGSDS